MDLGPGGPAAKAHVFLSPHLDDVALACGGLVAQLAAAGSMVTVITVCAGEGSGEREGKAAARRAEDQAALRCLGVEPTWWSEQDAPERLAAYGAAAALFGAPRPEDGMGARLAAWSGALTGSAAPPRARYYFPLAVGGHVDHRLVHQAGLSLLACGEEVVFYEDLPYALRPLALAERLAALPPLRPHCVDVTGTFAEKLQAVQRYRSQIPALFGTAGRMLELLTAYSVSLSPVGGRCCERLWLPAIPAAGEREA